MKTQSTDHTRWPTLVNLLLPAAIALIFFAFTFSYYPFREKIQLDTDEGLNLMRSMLVVLGHPLYSQVSSDQPPLFTHLLGVLFRVVGFEVNPARILVLLFSTLIVWSGAQFLQLTWGSLPAILFLPLALMVPRYLELSVSVMIGVPSIALAGLAMLLVTLWHQNRRSLWLILSGSALALSVLIKLFTGFVAPVFLIGITAAEYVRLRDAGFSWRIFRPALVWSISFMVVAGFLGLALIGLQNVGQLIFPHITATTEESFQNQIFTINAHLQAGVPLLVLGLIGALLAVLYRRWLTFYPLAWSLLAYILLNFHSPVFYHHQLLITIPAAIAAAAAVGEGIASVIRLRRPSDLIRLPTLVGICALAGFALVSSKAIPVLDRELMDQPRISGFSLKATEGKLKVVRAMNEYAAQTNWVVTDMPMYAFLIRRPVPPILATFSRKRLVTGSLTEEDILAAMQEYRPEQVLMARFEIPSMESYLQENYNLIVTAEDFRLYTRNDLKAAKE